VLPQNAETVVEEPQPEKKSRKKKGFSEKVPEVPTLEDLTGQQVTPEELAAVKTAEKLIAIPDEKLTELRPDLLTIDEQELQRALAEQQANRLTVVSTPAPPDADELEELI
jgi:ABC-type Fe3+-hydroxamate transport system substrate-binding protein